jgi:hypothetical protein
LTTHVVSLLAAARRLPKRCREAASPQDAPLETSRDCMRRHESQGDRARGPRPRGAPIGLTIRASVGGPSIGITSGPTTSSSSARTTHLVGSGRRDQRDEGVDELASLHQDVGGAVAPAGLEAKQEPAIRVLFEAVIRKGWACDVATQPLQAATVAGGHGHGGVETHAAVRGNARRGVGILARSSGIHAIPQASPRLAAVRSGGNACTQ